MIKTFKQIPNHTRYEISKSGQVRHRKFKRILKPSHASNGYKQVGIYNDRKQRVITTCIHQLMALTYKCKKPAGHEINFRDGNKENVSFKNLRYLPWQKNRPRKYPVRYCKRCGEKLKSGYKNACSRTCQWFLSRTLVKCNYCGREFYRRKGIVAGNTVERGYTTKKTYCNQACRGAEVSRIAKGKKGGLTNGL